MPVMVEFFDRLEERMKERGFAGSFLILKSSGGVTGVDLAKNHPEELLESGPAGGVAYAAYLSKLTDYPNFIHTDMGGTSFDASIVENGKGLITRDYELEWEIPVTVPMLDIHSVGDLRDFFHRTRGVTTAQATGFGKLLSDHDNVSLGRVWATPDKARPKASEFRVRGSCASATRV